MRHILLQKRYGERNEKQNLLYQITSAVRNCLKAYFRKISNR